MSKKRYYVVWNGLVPGIYHSWEECQAQIKGVKQALYKSFASLADAERAYSGSPYDYIGSKNQADGVPASTELPSEVEQNALAVDAACSGNPGSMEYQGVYVGSGTRIFHFGPLFGTNNIGEFLAIVHALALLHQKNNDMPIYSDSHNALLWVKQKKCKTKLERNAKTEEIFRLIDRAENWLRTHSYKNPLLKWETQKWGEIPADFGRK
ncbi:MAG: ribonuclease H family protein [Bacteroidaceae bacterium]|nr:ribonuclease H family protein [Bacteroidaceae bacterium]MBQ3623706.1 ribonuclease H family protein [Bacteroidaceae bacterium]